MSAITNISRYGSAAESYGVPYFPTPEEKEARQAADAERAERNRKAAVRRIERESQDDFKSLRAKIITLLGQWHKAQKRVLRYSIKEIKAAVIEHYMSEGRDGALIGQAATSAISEHLALDYDEIRRKKNVTRREAEKARLTYGFRWNGVELLGGKYRIGAFNYHGLRSNEHFWFRHFLSLTPSLRSGNYRSASNKELFGSDECDSKLLGLDEAWIDINKEVIGLLKQDIDAVFESWDHLRQEILDRNLPLPHIAVAHVDGHGRVHNPHLVWFLPKGQGVRTDEGAFQAPQKLYKAVQRGICNELMAIGGDPGGLVNFGRMKNPLSPLWSVCVMSEEEPISLRQWTDIVDIETRFIGLERDYSVVRAVRDGADETMSNAAFNQLRRAAFFAVLSWYRGRDARFTDTNREAVAGHLVKELGSQARHTLLYGNKPRAAMAILKRVAAFVSERFNTEKADKGGYKPNAGVLAETLPDDKGGKDRMAAGGKYVRAKALDKTMTSMIDAAKGLMKGGLGMSKSEIMKATGLSRATVYRRWDDMNEALKVESHKGPSKKAGVIRDDQKSSSSLSSDQTVSISQYETQPGRKVSPSNDNSGDRGLAEFLARHVDCPVDDINETDISNHDTDHLISEAA